MAQIFWKDEHPTLWNRFNHSSEISGLAQLEPWERHIPVDAKTLEQWRRELPFHKSSQYGQILKRDIAFAEKCNARGCEMIVSFREEAFAA